MIIVSDVIVTSDQWPDVVRMTWWYNEMVVVTVDEGVMSLLCVWPSQWRGLI